MHLETMSLRHLYFDEGTEKLPKTSIICLYMAQIIAPPPKKNILMH